MHAIRRFTYLVLLFSLLILAACTQPDAEDTPEAETPQATDTPAVEAPEETAAPEDSSAGAQDLAGTAWALESLGPVGSETPVMEETNLILSFDSRSELGGSGGCNSFGAGYSVEEGALVLGELVTTLIACDDQAVMDQELRFYEALRGAGRFEVSEEDLIIWYDDGDSAMHFTRAG